MSVQNHKATQIDAKGHIPDDGRSAPRFSLLIRSAKLLCHENEFLCVIRDISESGVRLRLFHPLPDNGPLQLEFSTGDRIPLIPVWNADGEAGLKFAAPIDVHHIIAETSPFPKRALRLRLRLPATITINGEHHDAVICDLSRQGARIKTQQPLAIEQKLTLNANMLPSVSASVRWRKGRYYGLALQHIFSFKELAQTIARMQLPAELARRIEICSDSQRHA